MNKKLLQGFTLTEILISLAIIGIVAALTVPGTAAKYQKNSQLTALKKVYFDMGQALTYLQSEYFKRNLRVKDTYLYMGTIGPDSTTVKTPEATVGIFLKKYFKYTKSCGTSATGCFAASYKSIEGDSYNFDVLNSYSILLKNGAAIAMVPAYTSSVDIIPIPGAPTPPTTNEVSVLVYVDVNGPDRPNVGGRDMFSFAIDNKFNIVPTSGTCTASSVGDGCLNEIIDNDWKIDY